MEGKCSTHENSEKRTQHFVCILKGETIWHT